MNMNSDQTSNKMPYPGLRPFKRNEADIFFGREEQVDRLLEMMGENPFLAVVGPSGCGKSSLVAAGLIPALELGLMEKGGENWKIARMRPGSDPLKNLAVKLLESQVFGPNRKKGEESLGFLLATLQRGPLGLAEALNETPMPKDHSLLVIADQFEEIFRYRQDNIDRAEAFIDLLLESAKQENIYVIITMRSDFLGDCSLFHGLPEAMNESQFLTPRLTREQRKGAIIGPAAMFNGKLEPALVNRLLNDMGADFDQLPVLQHLLMRMWTKAGEKPGLDQEAGRVLLTLDDYEAMGTMKQALSNHADEAFEELDTRHRAIAQVLFKCLCDHAGSGRDTRRPAALDEAAKVAGADAENVEKVVKAFGRNDRSFLFLNSEGIIDISHESLIRQWEKLKTWAGEEAASAGAYQRLEQTAKLWKKGRAGLWGTPDLDMALEWKEKQKPTPEWAARYGEDFDLALEFLDESEKKQVKDEEDKKREFQERTLHLFNTYLTHASLLAKMSDYVAARKILNQSRELDKEIPATRRHARNLLAWFTDLMGGKAQKVYQGAGVPLQNVAVSPDGRLLATVGEKGTVVLFDVESGEIVRRLEGHEKDVGQLGGVESAVFHPDGKWLATAGQDQRIIFWSVPDGEIVREIETSGKAGRLAFSTDGKLIASGSDNQNIAIWNAETGKEVKILKGHQDMISGLTFNSTGTLLASASYDRTARIWDVKTGKSIHTLRGHAGNVQRLVFHPDGNTLATCSNDKNIIMWQTETGRPLSVLQGHENIILGVAFTESGDHLISGSFDRTLRIWDTETGVTLRVLQGHEAGVVRLAVKENRIFSASNDMTVRQWDLQMEDQMRVKDIPGEPNSSAISPDGKMIAVGFKGDGLRLYSLPDISMIWEINEAHSDRTFRLSFSPDGKQIASASLDKTAKLWQVSDGKPIQTFTGHTRAVHGIAFSPDNKHISTASFDGRIGLFEIGREQGQFHEAHEGRVNSVEFDKKGEKLVSAGDDGAIRLWDIREWPPKLLRDFSKSADQVTWAAISPDGSRVAGVGRDYIVHIFNTNDGRETQRFVGHENMVFRVAFSPDGGQVATVSSDATVRFWDLETGEALFTLRLPTNSGVPVPLWDFTFRCTPTGCWLAVPLTRGKLVVYNMGEVYD
ncbi:hypothetical protein QUF70_05995 [Desulfobacterales bacterium HSG17]|nr:hypothetical protein [Desulfobacterales bacterium HSG17]